MTTTQAIQYILSEYGRSILDEHKRVEALLRDLCPEEDQRRDVNLTIVALKEGVSRELIAMNAPAEIVIGRLVKKLEDALYMSESVALMAIKVWANALNIILPELACKTQAPIQQLASSSKPPTPAMRAPSVPKEVHVNMEYYEAILLYKREEYAKALNRFLIAAEHGHTEAQYKVGDIYALGSGVPQDKTEAIKWFGKAADQGHVAAKNRLNYLYNQGFNVKRDQVAEALCACAITDYNQKNYSEAIVRFRMAASRGHAESQFRLGIAYFHGHGVTRDEKEATNWYSKAANQGHSAAKATLTRMS